MQLQGPGPASVSVSRMLLLLLDTGFGAGTSPVGKAGLVQGHEVYLARGSRTDGGEKHLQGR